MDLKEKQQRLFDQTNNNLKESFYRHSEDVLKNVQNLDKFKNSLSVNPPPLPERQTKLYTVEQVSYTEKKRLHWYSLKASEVVVYRYVVLQKDEFAVSEWDDINKAYSHANALNQQMLDLQTPEPKL